MALFNELKLVLSAENRATTEVAQLEASIKNLEKTGRALQKTGVAITAAGVGLGAVFVQGARNAIAFEDAFAGVRKTVDATESEFADLTRRFKELSKRTPLTFEELSKIGELAGQLGVQGVDDIEKFTETIAQIGVTTNLSIEDASTAFARIFNIMGQGTGDVDRLGSAVVALGNNLATTESEITQMSLGIAGVANVLDITIEDMTALAGALSSVGIEAQAGGTAISLTLQKMAESVANGSEELETFAKVAGVSAQEFATLFEENAVDALNLFTQGMGEMSKEGENVFAVFDAVQLQNIRVKRAILGLAGAGDLLTDSLAISRKGWEENNALSEEAQKRFKTTASQIDILKNNFTVLSSELGEALLPALIAIAEALKSVTNWFSKLSPRTKQFIAIGGALTAGLLVLTGVVTALAGTFLVFAASSATLGIALAPIVLTIGGIILAFGALIAIGVLVVKHWDTIKAKFSEVVATIKLGVNDLKERFMQGFTALMEIFAEFGNAIKEKFTGFVNALKEIWSFLWIFLQEFGLNMIGLIIGAIITHLDFFVPTWREKLLAIKEIAVMAWTAIKEFTMATFGAIKTFFIDIWESIKMFFSSIWTDMLNTAKVIMIDLTNFLQPKLEFIQELWASIWGAIKTKTSEVFDGIKEKVQTVTDFIARQVERIKSLTSSIKSAGSGLASRFNAGISSVLNAGRTAIGVNDAVIDPSGRIISTNPRDFLIATKDPSSLSKGGINLVISGNTIVGGDAEQVAEAIGDQIIERLGLQIRIG